MNGVYGGDERKRAFSPGLYDRLVRLLPTVTMSVCEYDETETSVVRREYRGYFVGDTHARTHANHCFASVR